MSKLIRIILILIILPVFPATTLRAQVIYVDLTAPGGGDGNSWSTAYTTIGDALAAATSGTQIWVADGVYSPAAPLEMQSGVALYGGFEGLNGGPPETQLSERDPAINVTIINGEFPADNYLLHVTRFNNTVNARLDGFTIRKGFATVPLVNGHIDSQGGGTICIDADESNLIANCVYTDNTAKENGGGIYCTNSAVVILNCRFVQNLAQSGIGGGIALKNNSSAIIVNCLFTLNDADLNGSGIGCDGSNPDILNCVFRFNQDEIGNETGALSCRNNAVPLVVNCTFSDHDFYGVVEEDGFSDPAITHCLFFNNSSGHYLNDGTTPLNTQAAIEALAEADNILVGNPFFADGGDYHLQSGSPLIDAGADVSAIVPAAALDGDGAARGFDGDRLCFGATGDGSDYDIGLYEYSFPAPRIEPDATSLNFGVQSLSAGPSAPLDVIITNAGDADTTFSAIEIIGGSNSGDFALTAAPDTSPLAGGFQRVYSVTFEPSATGDRSAGLQFINNDTCSGTLLIALSGIGVMPPAVGLFDGAMPLVNGVSSIDLGVTDLGGSALSRDFRVENGGGPGSTLLLSNLTVDPPFLISEGLTSNTLNSGEAEQITIALPADADGDFSGTVSLETNDSAQSPFTFEVTGAILPGITPGPPPEGFEASTRARFWEFLE